VTLSQRSSIGLNSLFNKCISYASSPFHKAYHILNFNDWQWTSEEFDNKKGLFLYIYLRDILNGFLWNWFGSFKFEHQSVFLNWLESNNPDKRKKFSRRARKFFDDGPITARISPRRHGFRRAQVSFQSFKP